MVTNGSVLSLPTAIVVIPVVTAPADISDISVEADAAPSTSTISVTSPFVRTSVVAVVAAVAVVAVVDAVAVVAVVDAIAVVAVVAVLDVVAVVDAVAIVDAATDNSSSGTSTLNETGKCIRQPPRCASLYPGTLCESSQAVLVLVILRPASFDSSYSLRIPQIRFGVTALTLIKQRDIIAFACDLPVRVDHRLDVRTIHDLILPHNTPLTANRPNQG